MFHNSELTALAGLLYAPGLEGPVVDMTGIQGRFTFGFVYPPWDQNEGSPADHLLGQVFPEVQRQLGLKVQGQTVPMDVMVVDHVDQAPTEN